MTMGPAARWPGRLGTRRSMPALFTPTRGYLDSVDRTMTVRSMEDPAEVLQFMAEHEDSDTRTHEGALRNLGRLITGANYEQMTSDARFHKLLSGLATRLDEADARLLSMIADASTRFRISTPELNAFAQQLAEVAMRRSDAFNPRFLTCVAMALSMRGVRDTACIEFIRGEALKLMNDFEPPHCAMLLEAFRRWGVFDRQLVDLVVERMSDEVDRFTARDVVDSIAVLSRLGLARGFLLRRLCTLAFEGLQQFTPRELTSMMYSLARLRFLSQNNVDDIVDVLVHDLHKLRGSQVTELLYALAMTNSRHQLDLVRALVTQYMQDDAGLEAKSLSSLIDFAWALCALDIADEFPEDLKAAMDQVFERTPPQNRVPLMKLFDVVCALEVELKELQVLVPAVWKAACEDADRFEMERLENSRLHNEIVMRLDHLRGSAGGVKWHLRMQRNQVCGPYRMDMFDEATKIGIDVEIISWPTSRLLKHRLLERLGYRPLRLHYWEWRRARTEEDQNTFLEREINQLLEASG